MSKQSTIRRSLLAMAVALAVNGTALAQVPELTFDDSGAAQGSGTINNDTGAPSVDSYSFRAVVGDVVTLDIDSVYYFNELDTVLYVFDPQGQKRHEAIIKQDDPASAKTTDSYVQFTVDIEGVWMVSVTANPAMPSGGSYDLMATLTKAANPPTENIAIDIDIEPHNPHTARIKPGRKGNVRVALLSRKGFDPFEVDETSLTFGRTGDETSLVGCVKRKDFNRDRKRDLVCRFDNTKAGFTRMDKVGIVKGKMLGGKRTFQGSGNVKVLSQKELRERKDRDDDDD